MYEAPATAVVGLGTAVTVPETAPEPWQLVQLAVLLGSALAAWGLMVPTSTAAVRLVASTATFGMLIFLTLKIFKGPPWESRARVRGAGDSHATTNLPSLDWTMTSDRPISTSS